MNRKIETKCDDDDNDDEISWYEDRIVIQRSSVKSSDSSVKQKPDA